MGYIVGVDTGSTFTDGVIMDAENMRLILKVKVLTTHYDLTECFAELLKYSAERLCLTLREFLAKCDSIRYSQTIATNTVITRSGVKLGLIVTEGHQRSIYSKETAEPPIYSFVSKEMVVGVDENVNDEGRVVRELRNEAVLEAADQLLDLGARGIVVALKNSFLNPVHELRIRDVIRSEYPPQYLGRVPVFLSHQIARVRDDYIRASSAVLDAYIHHRMAAYLYRAEDYAHANTYLKPLLLVNSDSSMSTIAWTSALSTIGSGPAAGVIGAALIGKELYGLSDLVTFDVGGTSFDIGLVRGGSAKVTYYSRLDGVRIFQPTADVTSIPIGGSSIIRVVDGEIRVGPESLGSAPGPACFDKGGMDPTPTDINLVLGYLNPKNFLGGRLILNYDRAKESIQRNISEPLGLDPIEASYRVKSAVEKMMTEALRKLITKRRSRDKLAAFGFGGGGAVHACALLSGVTEIGRIYLFPFSSEFSAMGCCLLDLGQSYYREVTLAEGSRMVGILDELADGSRRDITGQGYSARTVQTELGIYSGEEATFTPFESHNVLSVDKLSRMSSPYVLILRWRIQSLRAKFQEYEPSPDVREDAITGSRNAYWGQLGMMETQVYDVDRLRAGNRIEGPAIIEGEDTTVVLNPGFIYNVDRYGDSFIEPQHDKDN